MGLCRSAVGLVLLCTCTVTGNMWGDATENVGRVCIQPIPQNGAWKGNDTGATEQSVFTVKIDELAPVMVSTNGAGVISHLALAPRHVVKIQMDGKPLASFRFTFQNRSSHLRLWYNTMYGTWSLSDVAAGQPCACPKE